MSEATDTSLVVLLVGGLLVVAMLSRHGARRIGVPPLVVFLLLGIVLRGTDTAFDWMGSGAEASLDLLGELGVVALLFRVGLESNLDEMIAQLNRASLVWIGNMAGSAVLGFATSWWLLGLGLIPSLVVATALTATSVGVTAAVWQDRGLLNTDEGELFLDVAELDDISGVLLMVALFAVLPALHDGSGSVWPELGHHAGLLAAKLLAFCAAIYVFARFVERHLTDRLRALDDPAAMLLVVTGIGFALAGVAGLLGFSVAIGAFFAGLAFSRDPAAVKVDTAFEPIYGLLAPFFFVSIGLGFVPGELSAALGPAALLLVAAVLGKVLGAGLPTALLTDWRTGAVIGVAMVPRAEIAMIIMHRGHALGSWATPDAVYTAMILVVAATSLAGPIVLARLLGKGS